MTTSAMRRPILVVDDEPEMLASLRSLLRRDFEVHTAGSGAEGIAILEKESIHVVMTDQRMPQMTGVQFLCHVKDAHPEAIRLIFTGYADIKAVIDAINQGHVFRYVAKPWDPDELVSTLHEAGREYDRIVASEQLLVDLGDYQGRCLEFDAALRSGTTAALPSAMQTTLVQLVHDGTALSARIEEALRAFRPRPLS